MSQERKDKVWQVRSVVEDYLGEVSEAVPDRPRQLEVMLRLLGGLKRPVERLLDLGCGDGILTRAVLRQYPDATAVLVDFSRPMLEAAEARFAESKNKPTLIEADLTDAGTWMKIGAEEPFDAVVSAFAIHHMPDLKKREVFAEIFKWLRPGGLFINHEHVASQSRWIERTWDNLMIDSTWKQRRERGEDVDRETIAEGYENRADKEANILAPVELQCAWLRDIGFADVDCFFKLFEIATFGGRKPLA